MPVITDETGQEIAQAIEDCTLAITDTTGQQIVEALQNYNATQLNNKQNTLTAGTGISINNDTISLPFALAIDEHGNYGYIKAGADSVTPFNPALKWTGSGKLAFMTFSIGRFYGISDWIYNPEYLTIQAKVTTENKGSEIVFKCNKTFNLQILSSQYNGTVSINGTSLNALNNNGVGTTYPCYKDNIITCICQTSSNWGDTNNSVGMIAYIKEEPVETALYTMNIEKLTPVMTADNAPEGYEAFASNPYHATNYRPYKMFDENTAYGSDYYHSTSTMPQYVGFTWPYKVCISRIAINVGQGYTGRMPGTFIIQGSNDNWVTHDDLTTLTHSGSYGQSYWSWDTNILPNQENFYKSWRLYITASCTSDNYMNIGALHLYGYKEKETN